MIKIEYTDDLARELKLLGIDLEAELALALQDEIQKDMEEDSSNENVSDS